MNVSHRASAQMEDNLIISHPTAAIRTFLQLQYSALCKVIWLLNMATIKKEIKKNTSGTDECHDLLRSYSPVLVSINVLELYIQMIL